MPVAVTTVPADMRKNIDSYNILHTDAAVKNTEVLPASLQLNMTNVGRHHLKKRSQAVQALARPALTPTVVPPLENMQALCPPASTGKAYVAVPPNVDVIQTIVVLACFLLPFMTSVIVHS